MVRAAAIAPVPLASFPDGAPRGRSQRDRRLVRSCRALGLVDLVVRGLGRPGIARGGGGRRRAGRLGRRVRLGPSLEPNAGSVRRPVRHAGGDRDGDRAGGDRHDGHRPAATSAAARRSVDDIARSPVRWPDGAGPRPRGRQLRRVLGVRRAGGRRPRSSRRARCRDRPARADARRRTRRGRWRTSDHTGQRSTASAFRSGSPVGLGSAPVHGECAATDWRVWHWWMPTPGRPNMSRAALRAGELAAGEIDVALVGGTHPDPEALAAAGATWCFPEILPGTTAADALAVAATPPG